MLLVSDAQRPRLSATCSIHRSEGPQGPVCKHCEKKLVSNTWPENSDRVASNLAALHKNPPLLPAPLQFYFSLCLISSPFAQIKHCCVHNCFPHHIHVCPPFFDPFLAH